MKAQSSHTIASGFAYRQVSRVRSLLSNSSTGYRVAVVRDIGTRQLGTCQHFGPEQHFADGLLRKQIGGILLECQTQSLAVYVHTRYRGLTTDTARGSC